MHKAAPIILITAVVATFSGGCDQANNSLAHDELFAEQAKAPALPVLVYTAHAKTDAPLSADDARILVQSLLAENGTMAPVPADSVTALKALEPLVGGGIIYGRHAEVAGALAEDLRYQGKAREGAPQNRALVTVLVAQPSKDPQWAEFAHVMEELSRSKTLAELVVKATSGSGALSTVLLGTANETGPHFELLHRAPADIAKITTEKLQKGARLLKLIANPDNPITAFMGRRDASHQVIAMEAVTGAVDDALAGMKSRSWNGMELLDAAFTGDGAFGLSVDTKGASDVRNTWKLITSPSPSGIDDQLGGSRVQAYRSPGSMMWLKRKFNQKGGGTQTLFVSEFAKDHPKQLAEQVAPLLAAGWEPVRVFYRGPGTVAWFRCNNVMLPVADIGGQDSAQDRLARFAQGLADAYQAGCTWFGLFREDAGTMAVFVKNLEAKK